MGSSQPAKARARVKAGRWHLREGPCVGRDATGRVWATSPGLEGRPATRPRVVSRGVPDLPAHLAVRLRQACLLGALAVLLRQVGTSGWCKRILLAPQRRRRHRRHQGHCRDERCNGAARARVGARHNCLRPGGGDGHARPVAVWPSPRRRVRTANQVALPRLSSLLSSRQIWPRRWSWLRTPCRCRWSRWPLRAA